MLIETFGSIRKDFIVREQQIMLEDAFGYTKRASDTLRAQGPGRMTGSAYLVLRENYSPLAAVGFLVILQLLRSWAEESGEPEWLNSQFEKIRDMGADIVGDYVVRYTLDPSSEINHVSELLTRNNSPLRGFILYGEFRYPSFQIGAYFLLGLLLYAEEFSNCGMALTE